MSENKEVMFSLSKEDLAAGKFTKEIDGRRVTLALMPSDVHDPSELSGYLAGYKPFQFRADEVSPVVLVENDSDKYRTFSADDAFDVSTVKTNAAADPAMVDPSSSLATYAVTERALGCFIPQQTLNQKGNNYDPRMAASRKCATKILLDREIDAMALVGTNTNWDASVRTALAAGYNWNGGVSSDPIRDLNDAIQKSWQPVTHVVMNDKIFSAFLRHDSVKDYIKLVRGDAAALGLPGGGYGQRDIEIPGLPRIMVVSSKNKSGTSLTYTLGDVAVLATIPANVPMDGETVASSYSFRVRGESGTGWEVREYNAEHKGSRGGLVVVVAMGDVAAMTANKAGGIITGVYA